MHFALSLEAAGVLGGLLACTTIALIWLTARVWHWLTRR